MLYCKWQEHSQELERSNFAILYGTCNSLSGYLVQICALLLYPKENRHWYVLVSWAEGQQDGQRLEYVIAQGEAEGKWFVQPGEETAKGVLVAVSVIQVREYREDGWRLVLEVYKGRMKGSMSGSTHEMKYGRLKLDIGAKTLFL